MGLCVGIEPFAQACLEFLILFRLAINAVRERFDFSAPLRLFYYMSQ